MLKAIFTWFNSIFKGFVDSAKLSQEDKTRLQHYMIFMILGIPTMLIFGGINLLQHNYLLSVLAFVAAVGLLGGLFLIRTLKNGTWVYRVNAFLYVCLICYMIIMGGEDGSKVLWSYTLPLICCFLFGKREGGMWSIIVALFALFAFSQSTIFSVEVYNYSSSFQMRFIVTYIFCTIIAIWLESSRTFYLNKSKAIRADLVKEHNKLKEEIDFRKKLEKELKRVARIDQLTGVMNRGGFFLAAEKEWNKHARNEKPLSFAVIDIDHFKIVNDKYGHPAGDEVLIKLSQCTTDSIRDFDVFGRVGGEEFALLFAETNLKVAKTILERLRKNIENMNVEYDGEIITCTVSIGLYTAVSPMEILTEIYKKADLALYQAKGSGRNKVNFYSGSD